MRPPSWPLEVPLLPLLLPLRYSPLQVPPPLAGGSSAAAPPGDSLLSPDFMAAVQ